MNLRTRRTGAGWLLLFLVLAACNFPAGTTDRQAAPVGPQTWIDDPLPGEVLDLRQAPFIVLAHANDAAGLSRLEFGVNGETLEAYEIQPGDDPYFEHAEFPWVPPAPGTYLLTARSFDVAGGGGPAASIEVLVLAEGIASPTPDGTETPTSTPTATPSPTAASPVDPMATFLQASRCRYGDSTVFGDAAFHNQGDTLPALGRNRASTWIKVRSPIGGMCWAFVDLVELNVPIESLPVLASPPTPTPIPSPTATLCAVFAPCP